MDILEQSDSKPKNPKPQIVPPKALKHLKVLFTHPVELNLRGMDGRKYAGHKLLDNPEIK